MPTQKTILVIEDDSALSEMFAVRLEVNGYRVITAADKNSLFRFLESAVPNLILIDQDLPDINGLEICRMVRREEEFKEIPIFVHTRNPDEEAASASGCTEYFVKPFELSFLVRKIRETLEE